MAENILFGTGLFGDGVFGDIFGAPAAVIPDIGFWGTGVLDAIFSHALFPSAGTSITVFFTGIPSGSAVGSLGLSGGGAIIFVGIPSGSAVGAYAFLAGQQFAFTGIPSRGTKSVTPAAARVSQGVAAQWTQERLTLLDGPSAPRIVLVGHGASGPLMALVQSGTYRLDWRLTDATGTADGPGATSAPFTVSQLGALSFVAGAVSIAFTGIPSGSAVGTFAVTALTSPIGITVTGIPSGSAVGRSVIGRVVPPAPGDDQVPPPIRRAHVLAGSRRGRR